MSTRRPLVVIAGSVQELPAGDALPADATGGAFSIFTTQTFSATAGQLSFTVSGGYTVGQVAVFHNGSKLSPTDYTATSGTTIVLALAAVQYDVIEVLKWTSMTVANVVAKVGDTMTGKLTITGVFGNGFEIQSSATAQFAGPGMALTALGAGAQYAQSWMQHILNSASDPNDTSFIHQQRDSSGTFVNNVYQFSYKNQAHSFYTGNAVTAYIDSYGGSINGSLAIGLGGSTSSGSYRLYVRGKGSTSATYALLVQNSGGNNLFEARDDGALNLGSAPASPVNQTTNLAPNLYMDANGWLYSTTYTPPAQVNADWNSGSGLSRILNKPTLVTALTGLSDVNVAEGAGIDGYLLTYNNATSKWIAQAPVAQTPGVPAGVLMPFAGAAAPSGYLLCAGQAVSRTTYATLFAAIGTLYGTGDGSTTFNLPDLRGRSPHGVDNMNGTAANRVTSAGSGIAGATLGAVGGAETVTLTAAQMPAHTHTEYGTIYTTTPGLGGGSCGGGITFSYGYAEQQQATGSIGGGGAHTNMPPTIMLNYIIKT